MTNIIYPPHDFQLQEDWKEVYGQPMCAECSREEEVSWHGVGARIEKWQRRLDRAIQEAFPERWMIDAAISRDELGLRIAERIARPR